MSKKLISLLIFVFIFSILLIFLSTSYKNHKVDSLNIAKNNMNNNHTSIKTLTQDEIDNRGFLNELKSNPDGIAQNGKDRVDKFIKEIKKAQDKKDEQKASYYQQHLDNYATKTVIQSNELKRMTIPKKYDLYINTSRGHYMQFMVKDTTTKKPSKYLTINYNNTTHQIENISEYEVRS